MDDEGEWVIVGTEDVTVTPIGDPNDPYSSGLFEMTASRDLEWNDDESDYYRVVPMVLSQGTYLEDQARGVEFTANGESFDAEIEIP